MNIGIDWSKAPEGATHAHVRDTISPFRKYEEGVWWAFLLGEWRAVMEATPKFYVERPTSNEWSGEGLPPVGAVCRLRTKRDPEDAFEGWGNAEILYSSERALVWRWVGHSLEFGSEWTKVDFEVIRTPEQIAAEEREKAIAEMIAICRMESTDTRMVEALYLAGYRKQVQP